MRNCIRVVCFLRTLNGESSMSAEVFDRARDRRTEATVRTMSQTLRGHRSGLLNGYDLPRKRYNGRKLYASSP